MEIPKGPKFIPGETNDKDKIAQRIQSIEQALVTNSLPVLVVEASSACNLTCSFCGMHSKELTKDTDGRPNTKPKMHMPFELFQEIVDKCGDMKKLKVLYLHGNGEPLLNPNLAKMVHLASKANIAEQIIIVTNGVLLNSKIFKELFEAGVTGFRVSLDTFTADKFRQEKGANLSKRLLDNIDACIELIRTERLTVPFAILCVSPEDKDKSYNEETKQILEYYGPKIKDLPSVVIQYRKLFDWVGSVNRITDGGVYRRKVPCEQPFYLLMIHSDGDVSMCCADTTKQLIVGDIRKAKSLKEIIASEALSRGRKSLLVQNYGSIPACEKCAVYSMVDRALVEKREGLLGLLEGKGEATAVR